MPPGTVLGHVHLYVDDIAKAEPFYHDALGFRQSRVELSGALFMSAGGYSPPFISERTRGLVAHRPRRNADARLLEWEIIVPQRKTPRKRRAMCRQLVIP